jgi:hypothetical protein
LQYLQRNKNRIKMEQKLQFTGADIIQLGFRQGAWFNPNYALEKNH